MSDLCPVPDCGRIGRNRGGYCHGHALQIKRGEELHPVRPYAQDCPHTCGRHSPGSHTCYTHCSCRCRECREATTRKNKEAKHTGCKGSTKVDATGARRRLQALAVIGWSPNQIAETSGLHPRTVSNIQAGRAERIAPRTFVAACAAFEALCMTLPPLSQGRSRSIVMAHASRHGWVGPLSYDNIDDPAEVPSQPEAPVRGRHQRSVYAEDVEWLADSGETLEAIAIRLGIKVDSVERALYREGREDLVHRLKGSPPEPIKVAA